MNSFGHIIAWTVLVSGAICVGWFVVWTLHDWFKRKRDPELYSDPESEIQEPGLVGTWAVMAVAGVIWIYEKTLGAWSKFTAVSHIRLGPEAPEAGSNPAAPNLPPSVGASGPPEVNPIASGSLGGKFAGDKKENRILESSGQSVEHIHDQPESVGRGPTGESQKPGTRPPSDGSSESESRGVSLSKCPRCACSMLQGAFAGGDICPKCGLYSPAPTNQSTCDASLSEIPTQSHTREPDGQPKTTKANNE